MRREGKRRKEIEMIVKGRDGKSGEENGREERNKEKEKERKGKGVKR